MSSVTNVILTFSLMDEDKLSELNRLLNAARYEQFSDLPADATTGSKHVEAIVCVGAFNFFDVNMLVEAIKHVAWRCPESVSLFVQGQDDDKFSPYPPPTEPRRGIEDGESFKGMPGDPRNEMGM